MRKIDMTEQKAVCGLVCSDCPAFIATKNNDNKLREKTAKKWTKEFGYDNPPLKPEDINCSGCLSEKGPLFLNCRSCEVRKCGINKKIKACRKCNEYKKCEKIRKLEEHLKKGQ